MRNVRYFSPPLIRVLQISGVICFIVTGSYKEAVFWCLVTQIWCSLQKFIQEVTEETANHKALSSFLWGLNNEIHGISKERLADALLYSYVSPEKMREDGSFTWRDRLLMERVAAALRVKVYYSHEEPTTIGDPPTISAKTLYSIWLELTGLNSIVPPTKAGFILQVLGDGWITTELVQRYSPPDCPVMIDGVSLLEYGTISGNKSILEGYAELGLKFSEHSYLIAAAVRGRAVALDRINAYVGRERDYVPEEVSETNKRYQEIIDFLLAKGCNINGKHQTLGTPLKEAVTNNNSEAVKLLLERGADPNLVMYTAIIYSKTDIVLQLLDAMQGSLSIATLDSVIKGDKWLSDLLPLRRWRFLPLLIKKRWQLKRAQALKTKEPDSQETPSA